MQDKTPARKGAGVANVVRQTWDRAHYEQLAKLRADGQLEKEEVRLCVRLRVACFYHLGLVHVLYAYGIHCWQTD